MGSTDFIYRGWEKERRLVSKTLAALKKDPDKETVHTLRVTVKKLKAAVKLHTLITKDPFLQDSLKETEQLFEILGKQRDTEIYLEIIDGLKKDTRKKVPELKNYFLLLLPVAYTRKNKAVRQYKKKELKE